MICPSCSRIIETKEIKQCTDTDCLNIMCAKCYEIHEMSHRHEKKPNKLIKFFTMWQSSLFKMLPAVLILLLLTVGANLTIGNSERSIAIPKIFNSTAEIKFVMFASLFLLLPPTIQLAPFKYLKSRFKTGENNA